MITTTTAAAAAGSLISDETAARIRDMVKSIAHFADQERRDRDETARIARIIDTAEEHRRHHLGTRATAHAARADKTAETVRTKRETLAALLTVKVALPGAFCDFFEGTNLAQGLDNSDPECAVTHAAWDAATYRRYGRNGYTMTVTTSDMTVLDILAEYAGNCLESNADDPDPKEVKAAHETLARVKAARAELRALTTLAREAQEEDDAHRAANAASIAAYDEMLTARVAADTAQRAQEAPQTAQEAPTAPEAQEAPQEAQEAPTAPVLGEGDPYPAHNTQGRCTHGYTCRYNRPEGTPGEWIHPDADHTPCTANPTMHVTWTGTVKGHHHATVTLPGGARARITYIPRGTAHTFVGRASMGTGSPIVARANSLSVLLHQYAQTTGYQTFTAEEYGTPTRPATAADYTTT
jgi:hypothetical protein